MFMVMIVDDVTYLLTLSSQMEYGLLLLVVTS